MTQTKAVAPKMAAGRPSDGIPRKTRQLWLSDKELDEVRKLIKKMREKI